MKWIRKNCLILRPPILFSMTHLKKTNYSGEPF